MIPAAAADTGETSAGSALDVAFLAAQTFHDRELEREVLQLFLAQARRVLPRLAGMTPREQSEAAHLLRGACQGIGALPAAAILQTYEDGNHQERLAQQKRMVARFAELEVAILAREIAP